MKVGKKQIYIIVLELCALLCSALYLGLYGSSLTFAKYSGFGVVVLLLDLVLFCIAQKRIVTIQTLFLMLFVLFQFGLPIVYAFNPKHYIFYMTLFSEKTLISAVKYTIFAIQTYIIIATCVISNRNHAEKKGKVGKWTRTILTHPRDVEDAALLLFIVTAIVAVPVNLWSAVRALTAGVAIGNLYRGAMAANGLTRFLQEFFFSSALLYLCFSNKKKRKKVVVAVYLVVALSMVLVADRSGGVTALIVCALYYYYTGDKRKRKKNTLVLIGVGVVLAIVSSAVASIRSGESSQSGISLLFSALEEMGFNFTSLCFVMDYIPSRTSYRLGMSYIVALILLIPKSLGLGAVYPKLQSYLGETWLWNANNLYGRDFLSFGVGFSMIAESYYNFSWCGLVVMIPLAVIITHLLKEKNFENAWSLYIRLALMLSFFTVPRRQFQSVIKAIEYSVFFMALYLLVYIGTKRKDKRNETANDINRCI